MACRGVHFALTADQRAKLLSLSNDQDRIDYICEDLEEAWDKVHLQETDKAWDAIHRCLTDHPPDTSDLDPQSGQYPLKLCILGGRQILDDESGYILRLIEAKEVVDLAKALQTVDQDWMSKKYRTHCKGAWPEFGEEDLAYTWEWFSELKDFFRRTADSGRCVVFSVDQ